MSTNVKNETLYASIDSPKEKMRPMSNNNNKSREAGSRNNNKRNRRSTPNKNGDILFSQPGPMGGRPSINSREEIDVTKLTQAIFRKRMGGGQKGSSSSNRRSRKKKYEAKKRIERVGTPLSSSGLMGGGSNNLGITKSGLKLGQTNNINHMKNSVAKTTNETVNQLLEQITSPVPNAPQRKVSDKKIPNNRNNNNNNSNKGMGTVTMPREKGQSRGKDTNDFAGFQNGNNLSGWDTDPHLLSPTHNGNKNDAETKDNYNKNISKKPPLSGSKRKPSSSKTKRPHEVNLKISDTTDKISEMPDVRFTFSADRQKVERELPLQFEETKEMYNSNRKRNDDSKLVPGVPKQTNIRFSPMRIDKDTTTTNNNNERKYRLNKANARKELILRNMPKEVQWTRSNFMLPSKAAHGAAASAHVPYDRTLPTLSKGLENFTMRLGGIHLKQSVDVLPEPVLKPEIIKDTEEEVVHNPAFHTAKSAAQFWLRNLLRTHNLKQGVGEGGWRGKENLRRLAEFLSSAVQHVRYACQAEGWTTPDRAELERQVYNIVVDELSGQVAAQTTTRGTLLEMITSHFQDVVGDALPLAVGSKDTLMSSQKKEMTRLTEENHNLKDEIKRIREEVATIAISPPTASSNELLQKAENAQRLVTSRDAELIALRRQNASLKRSLEQSQLTANNQAIELETVRGTLRAREDESIHKVKAAKEKSIDLRKQLTVALTKVAQAEENEKWVDDQDYPGQIRAAEEQLKKAREIEENAKKKLHNANRTELALYSKVKDLEEFTANMEGNIRDLKGFQNMMQGMMGKVESIRRASVAIRHNIPVSKLSGDPAVMQEVVNRMTAKAIEAEKKMNEVIVHRDKLIRNLSLEQQKVAIQGQQVLDAREAQSRLEVELFELHEEFDSVVGELREANAMYKDQVEQLTKEKTFLMEHASTADEDSSRIEVTEDAVLALKRDCTKIKKEQDSIMSDTTDMLLEFEGLFASLAVRIHETPVQKNQIKMFTDAILDAAQPSPVTKPIGRRRSINNLKSKKRAKKRVRKRRMKLDKKFTEEDAENDEKFEMAVELSKNTLKREKEVLENKIMMMQLEFEAATKKKEETLEKSRKELEEALKNHAELQAIKAKEVLESEELTTRRDELKAVEESKAKKQAEIEEVTKQLEDAIVRTQEEELRLEDITDSALKDEQKVVISNNQGICKKLEGDVKKLNQDLKLINIEFNRLTEDVGKLEKEHEETINASKKIEEEDPDLKRIRTVINATENTEITALKQLGGTRRRLRRIKHDLDDVGHLRNKATAVLKNAGRKGIDEEKQNITSPEQHEAHRADTIKALAAKQAKALFAENKVELMEKKLDEARKKAAETNPELNKTLNRLEEMRMEREKSELYLINLRKELKITLNGEEEVNIEKQDLDMRISKIQEEVRKSQLKYDMKMSIKEQSKKQILEAGESLPPSFNEPDEEEMDLETHLVDVKAMLEECKASWDAAEEKLQNIHKKSEEISTNLKIKETKIEELDQEVDRLEDEIVSIESEDFSIQAVRNDYQEAMEEELEVWDEVAATQAAVELLDTESAEIQEKEEERLRQKRAAAKRERQAQLEASKPREIEIEEEITEIVIDADGTKREVKKKVKRKIKMKPARSRGTQTKLVVSKAAANAALPMLRTLQGRILDERTFLDTLRKDTRSKLQRMGGELSSFATKLGDAMGMTLVVEKIAIKAPPTPPPKRDSPSKLSLGAGGGGGGNRGRGPISPIGGGGKVSKEIQSQLDKNIPGTAAWLANNAGALEEFNKVKDQMNEEINSLSAEQRKIHDAAATKIQAMARARHGRLIVQEIRNQKQKEEDATAALLEFGASQDEDVGDIQLDSMRRMMGVDSKLSKMENKNNLKRAQEADPGAWEQKLIKEAEATRKLEAKMTEQARQAQKAQMERSIKMRKRVIMIERRVKELENILTRKFASKFKMKASKGGGSSSGGGLASSLKAMKGGFSKDANIDGDANSGTDMSSDAVRLANTPGSVHSIHDPRGFNTRTPGMTPGSSILFDEMGEEDKWMEKPSWDSTMPGLRKNYPSTMAKYSSPGGANPNEWRDKIKYARDGWANRVERYKMNKRSFHELLRKRAGLTPAKISDGAKGLGDTHDDLSKTVSNQLGMPKEWGGSRATTPGLLNDVDDNNMESMEMTTTEPKKSLEPRQIAWVMKTLRCIYDDKLLAECAAFRNGFQAPTLPEYLCEWASVRYGVPQLIEQMCWDLYRSCQFYRQYSLEVDIFSNFMDEVYGTAELSFYMFTRALVLDTVGEASSAAQNNLAPTPLPLSVAVRIATRVLAGLKPVFLAHALHKMERNAKPDRPNDLTSMVDVDTLFANIQENDAMSKSYVSNEQLMKGERDRKKKERAVFIQFKERILASCGRDANSNMVITQSGEREIDAQRFLYLCLREFRSAQRRFKRNLRETLKSADLSSGYDAITEREFSDSIMPLVPTWSNNEVGMIFGQGKTQVQNVREKDGFSTTETTRVPGKTLVKLSTQMWSHTFLLPHARINDPYDPDNKISLERRLQTLLGAVSAHWPSFEPSLNRMANRVGQALSLTHSTSHARDQGLRHGSSGVLAPTVKSKMHGGVTFNAHRLKPGFTPYVVTDDKEF